MLRRRLPKRRFHLGFHFGRQSAGQHPIESIAVTNPPATRANAARALDTERGSARASPGVAEPRARTVRPQPGNAQPAFDQLQTERIPRARRRSRVLLMKKKQTLALRPRQFGLRSG